MTKYKIAAFFSGVGGIELGFEQTGFFKTIFANEFDKNAGITYQLNHPETPFDSRDIHDVLPTELPNNIDIMVGGFPCQAFSIAGYQKGFEDDRGDLFFELLRLIKAKRPQAIFIENVKNMVTHDNGNTFKVIREALTINGYSIKWKVMNSKDYGNIPQNRERIYIVGFLAKQAYNDFTFPEEITLQTSIKDIINFNHSVDEKYYYSPSKNIFYNILEEEITDTNAIYQWRRQYVRKNKNGVVPTLTANMGTGGHNVPLILTNDSKIRKLTPKETFNVQGFPKEFLLPKNVADGQLYKQAGNSVVVPVIKRIATKIANALHQNESLNEIYDNGNFAIIYVNLKNQFEGQSHIINFFDSVEEGLQFLHSKFNNPLILSDDEYAKILKTKKQIEFFSIKKI